MMMSNSSAVTFTRRFSISQKKGKDMKAVANTAKRKGAVTQKIFDFSLSVERRIKNRNGKKKLGPTGRSAERDHERGVYCTHGCF